MAFTGAQKTLIRHYLGYPQVYRASNPRLESAITVVEADADASALAVSILADITSAHSNYLQAISVAGIRTLDKDDVGFFDKNLAIAGKAAIGRACVSRLSILFGVPIVNDIFSPLGYQGDGWKAVRVPMLGGVS